MFVETGLLAALGCFAGVALGAGAAFGMQRHGLDLRSFYPHGLTISGLAIDPILHARVTAATVASTTGMVLGAILLLCLVPVRQSTRVRIVEWLR